MAESVSQLQAKLKALTHGKVDIMLDADTYKNTTQILREMSVAWEDMTDKERSAALELMGGKRQSNILSSIIKNFQTVEDVIQTSVNSQGSAYAENEKYLNSIQGRIDVLTNSMQTLWMNTLNSSVLKFLLDIANGFVNITNKVGLLNTAISSFLAFKAFKNSSILGGLFTGTSIHNMQVNNKSLMGKLFGGLFGKQNTADVDSYTQAVNKATDAASEMNDQTNSNVISLANHSAAVRDFTIEQEAQTGAATGATVANQANAQAETQVGVAGAAASIGVKMLNAALSMGIALVAGFAINGLIKGIDKFIHRAERLKEEVDGLKDTYESAKKTFDDNITALTTSSDSSIYSTLEDEFERLTRGVDQYGNNISLTSDQYERYKEICEKIVGIQPSIAAGYDSATKAIGNNASVLSELIELQKIQARNDTDNLISDENASKIAENARNNYNNAITKQKSASANQSDKLNSILMKKFQADSSRTSSGDFDFNANGTSKDDYIAYVLKQLGKNDINSKVQSYYVGAMNDYDISKFISDYADEIKANTEKFGDDYKLTLDDTFMDIEQAITSAGNDVKEAQDGLINDFFMIVPQGKKAGEYYDQLNDASKKFVTEWIKNDSQFKLSENKTDEAVTAHRDNIIKVIKKLTDDNFTLDFEGEQITAQDFIDKFYNFDPNTVNWGDYKAKKQELFDQFWKQIGGADNEYGIKKSDLKVAFGIEFIGDEDKSFGLWDKNNKATETKSQVSKMINKSEDELQKWLDSLPASKVQKFYEIEWNKVDNSNIKSFGDVEDELDKQIGYSNVLSVKTYSDLSETIENFNEIQSQTEGIVANNTEVTQEYKDSLVKLGIAEEDLNDCFDDSNPLLVKNAALLRKLVSQKKAEKQATVQAAKAQTQMQYKNTVNQLKQVVSAMQAEYKANGMVSNSTLKTVGVLRSQLTELKQTVQQYALLELKLTEAANAYDEFEAAKNRDAELSYGDSMVEMLEVINEGFKTGKVGSETFQAAVKALVPESVYKDIDDLEARMIAIHDYIDKNPVFADYFTIDDDGKFSITYDNIKAFIQDGLKDGVGEEFGVFTGTLEDFELSDNIKSVKDLADAYGITEAAALAMLSTFEQYDASWGNILTELTTKPLDRQINKATDSLDEALAAQEAFIRSGGDLNSDEYKQICANVEQATTNLNTATIAAKNNAQQWTQLETVYAAATGKISLTQEAADQLARSLGLVDENGNPTLTVDDNGTLQLTQDQVDLLNGKVKKLEEPSVMQIQLQYDEIVAQIDELKSYRDKELTEDDRNEIKMKFGLKEGSDAEIDAKIAELTKERETITLKYQITQTTSEQETGAIEKLQDWETNGMSFSVNAQTDEAKGKIDELNTEKNKLSEPETTTYIVDGTGEFTVKSINDYWTKIVGDKSTTYTIYENTIATETKTNANNAPSSSAVGSGRPRVDGTAHAQGYWGATKTETALTGELGPEILVRNGRWTTIGENGAEFTQIKKGDIIFNHKQTEELLKNGYVTGRGKAYANGTSYGGNSLLDRMKRIINSNKLDQLAQYAEEMCEQYEKLTNGNVDLRKRPHLSPSYEHELAMSGGYNSFIGTDGEIYASTSAETMTIGEGESQYTIDITPVLENGDVLTSDALAEYVNNLVTDGSMQDLLDSDKYNLIIRAVPGEYNEKDWSEFEDKLSKYKDGYLDTILDIFDIGGEKAVEKYGFSSVGLADVSRDLKNNGSYIGKEVASAIDNTSEGMRNLDNLINQYVTDILNVGDTEAISNFEEEIESTASELVMAGENINDVQAKLDLLNATNISDKTFTVTTFYQTIGSGLEETVHTPGGSGRYTKYANGTVHTNRNAYSNGNFGVPKTETALVGELGPEMLVRNGRWTTVGDNGAEFTQVKKGDIIFNHRQTEELLKNGYVTGRGKTVGSAYVSGTIKTGGPAYYGITGPYVGDNDVFKNGSDKWIDPWTNTANALNDAADSLSDSADDFEEVFDWIEVRIEEIDEKLSLLDAQRENAVYYTNKNNIIDQMINVNNAKLTNLAAGLEKYTSYAAKLLSEVPMQYRDAAQNGMIAITEFAGEANEATLKAIENYREWAQKVADLKQQLEETKTTIRDLAIEKFDNAYKAGDVRATVEDSQTKKLQNRVDYDEERGLITSDAYYVAMMENSNKKIEYLTEARKAMQKELDDAVKAGQIIKGSNEWYELIDQLYQVQSEIDEATIELEQFQNAINDLYWENFDELINRLDYLQNETQNLIDLMDHADMVTKPEGRTYEGGTVKFWTAEDVQWTEEGIASLGLYAQQMEIAEYKAKQYAEAIKDLEKDYQDGKYSESEYLEKLNELKDAQYENIEAFYDAQDAIKSLNEARIDEIKTGIEKQIDAYQELIDKQKEQLNAEKD